MFLMKQIIIIFALIFLILPFVSADTISTGYKGISIDNKITNINDFPDYVFVSVGSTGLGPGIGMCPPKIISKDGMIGEYYKRCSVSVYAIEKSKFNESAIYVNKTDYSDTKDRDLKIQNYLDENAKEVISGIGSYTQVPITSTKKEINYYYTIDLNTIKTSPDDKMIVRNNLIYYYIGIPIIALIIILIVLLVRKKNAN